MRHRTTGTPRHSGGGNRPNQGGNNRPRRYNNNNNRSGGSSFDAQNDSGNVTRVRRHATAMKEKYYNMARDQLTSGDRVQAEYYFQHVEHYTRVLNDLPPEQIRQHYTPHNQNAQGGSDDQNQQQNGNSNGNSDNNSEQSQQQEPQPRFSQDDHPPAESALPAFITGGVSRPRQQQAAVPVSSSDEE